MEYAFQVRLQQIVENSKKKSKRTVKLKFSIWAIYFCGKFEKESFLMILLKIILLISLSSKNYSALKNNMVGYFTL